MQVFYNGVLLGIVNTQPGTRRQTVRSRDGAAYLYTRWRLDFLCAYNPGTTNAAAFGLPPLVPLAIAPGFIAPSLGARSPAYTDTQLRDLLRQDRKKLLVFLDDGQLLLESPLPAPGSAFSRLNTATGRVTPAPTSYAVDANNGPRVLECDIIESTGIRTFIIRFVIETDVVETGPSVPASALLSHRWDSRMDTGQDFLATRVIRGELVFRADELARLKLIPDQFRTAFGHPLPRNFARHDVNVFGHSDGNVVEYEVVDVERHFNLGTAGPATRFEAFLSSNMEVPSPIINTALMAADMAGRWGEAGMSIAQTRSQAVAVGTREAAKGSAAAIPFLLASAITDSMKTMVRAAIENLPKYNQNINVRAWGPRATKRAELHQMCLSIAFGRLGAGNLWRAQRLNIAHELSGKFVEVSLSYAFGIQEGVVGVINAAGDVFQQGLNFARKGLELVGGPPALGPQVAPKGGNPMDALVAPFFGEDLVGDGGRIAGGRWATQDDVGNLPLTKVSGGTRGSSAANLVAQVLYDAGTQAPPAAPPASYFLDVAAP